MLNFATAQLARALVWIITLPTMTLILCVPACIYLVAKQSRGGLVAFVGWIMAVRWGWLPAMGGPLGIHPFAFWPLTVLFGVWFSIGFWVMLRAAWRRALLVNRLMRDYRMPAAEIV
jgi:hypothetical protein